MAVSLTVPSLSICTDVCAFVCIPTCTYSEQLHAHLGGWLEQIGEGHQEDLRYSTVERRRERETHAWADEHEHDPFFKQVHTCFHINISAYPILHVYICGTHVWLPPLPAWVLQDPWVPLVGMRGCPYVRAAFA
jgi:hypothetical protein